MALINCPECSTEVSDRAPACVRCGCPIREQVSSASTTAVHSLKPVWDGFDDDDEFAPKPFWKKHKVAIIIVAVILALMAITNPSEKKHQRAAAKLLGSVMTGVIGADDGGSIIAGVLGRGVAEGIVERQNFLLFSLTRNTIVDEIIGFGAIGNVWLFVGSPKDKVAEVPRVIASFESAVLAADAEGLDLSLKNLLFNIPDSRWWTYSVTHNGSITATSKIRLGNAEVGATLASTYNNNEGCFYRTIHPELAKLSPVFAKNNCPTPNTPKAGSQVASGSSGGGSGSSSSRDSRLVGRWGREGGLCDDFTFRADGSYTSSYSGSSGEWSGSGTWRTNGNNITITANNSGLTFIDGTQPYVFSGAGGLEIGDCYYGRR